MVLSKLGYELREVLAEHTIEVTPSELEDALWEADIRIGGGTCRFCKRDDQELRYGVCFDCAT